jgi:hypothetical protein
MRRPPVRPGAIGRSPAKFAALAMATVLAGCGIGARLAEVTPAPSASAAALSATLQTAAIQVRAAFSAARYQVADARVPYRTGESPALAAAPRTVLQAILPAAPDGGFIVLFELADPGTASGAAEELVQYLASGPGRIQFPNDARFTIRQLGAAVAFYVWSPAASTDPEGERGVETVLASLGQGYGVPS